MTLTLTVLNWLLASVAIFPTLIADFFNPSKSPEIKLGIVAVAVLLGGTTISIGLIVNLVHEIFVSQPDDVPLFDEDSEWGSTYPITVPPKTDKKYRSRVQRELKDFISATIIFTCIEGLLFYLTIYFN